MGLANQNVAIVNAVSLGNNGPTLELNNRPTLIVSRSTAEPATKSISLSGIQAVNFISGVNALLQSATLHKCGLSVRQYSAGRGDVEAGFRRDHRRPEHALCFGIRCANPFPV